MANIAVTTAGRIEILESNMQHTAYAFEAILAGAPVRFDPTTGDFRNGNGTDVTEGNIYGLATKSVAAREPLTAVRKGVLDGFTFSQDYGSAIFVSDTDGRIADAAGTVSIKVGRVLPVYAQPLGSAADKVLAVDFNN